MEELINSKLADTKKSILDNFDEDVHNKLKIQLDNTKVKLDRFGKLFWRTTKFELDSYAKFDDIEFSFDFNNNTPVRYKSRKYYLISKERRNEPSEFLYRMSHLLGEFVIDKALNRQLERKTVVFDISNHPTKISLVEELKGKSSSLALGKLTIDLFEREEYLLFNGYLSNGQILHPEVCPKLFECNGHVDEKRIFNSKFDNKLIDDLAQHSRAVIVEVMEVNQKYFIEEQERLDKWEQDMILSVEKALEDTKAQIKLLERQARRATSIKEQNDLNVKIAELEKLKRKQRREIFDIEDEIREKREELILALQKKMEHKTNLEILFIIDWKVQ